MAIDLPGHLTSPDPPGGYLESIRALLATLPASIDDVIGYSLGGRIALSLIQLAPDRFRTATILSAHPGLRDPSLRAQRRLADQVWIRLLREHGLDAFVTAWEQQPLFRTQARLAPELLAQQRARRLSHRPDGLACVLERLGLGEMPSTWDALADYRGQLNWIIGSEDRRFQAIAHTVLAQRPATRLMVLEAVGHNPLLEAPERVLAAVSFQLIQSRDAPRAV
ncbi:2-succinyl-5-enolpyruvyl-6-hydroxy-3-cyclohexene-1-carboxylate synthase/2-succinyl-6-hydroxy-2,4-cyclohexadiene-1-carboxylate synthase [Allochromatium warmingii]|uniref:2-succinyl-5-enolpyruvyl-6-hydroxy-3-cyclohexene-1-carboxylate synthase/2-succinyl-6-hydroxy-2,4-cyclohexadiene-1-carboxylate synthase n=1 Tax=Allochromatium warmingii TaxID=61595 RepID=A0A1H3CKD9_ALLWA|nr:2-succinyl-5-enolpyruvyl-6-hydroxy-3-cyclohexene-1-carboxylate synthase/2-succinyl-6-hydroxy-2,4-cyclohexadiene-1-carboxylate synthase [Allochromatium warmingii]